VEPDDKSHAQEYEDFVAELREVGILPPPGMDDRIGNYVTRLAHLDAYHFDAPQCYDRVSCARSFVAHNFHPMEK
jgi:hypothetical protein